MTITTRAAEATAPLQARRSLPRLFDLLPYFGVALLVGVTIFFTLRSDVFLSVDNILNILVQ
jgi:ribose/xylose/arabinose/galactoside ABC-type transport system permease subunit